jgi:hypothetical protein
MEIAVLAWGSLVWQPANDHGELRLRPNDRWREDGPLLPVEFARISSDGRLSLVVVPGYGTESRVLWRPSALDDLDAAIDNLAERETGAPRRSIHAIDSDGSFHGDGHVDVFARVAAWIERTGVGAAIWAGLTPGDRWTEHGHDGFSHDAAVSYVRSLEGDARARAVEYIRNAPPQVDTPVRRALRDFVGA